MPYLFVSWYLIRDMPHRPEWAKEEMDYPRLEVRHLNAIKSLMKA